MDEDRLIRIPEAARITGFSPNTLRNWRHRNIGPRSHRLAGSVVYYESEVRRWLADQLASSGAGGPDAA